MGIRSKTDRWSLSAANAARLVFPTSSISPNAYWSFIGENRARASDRVIHPRSPTRKALSDADNATSSTALSLRASGGTDMPGAKAPLMAFHIPMTERYIAALHGTTAALLGSLELEALRHHPAATASATAFIPRPAPVGVPLPGLAGYR